jgi:chaperonin GroEL
MGVALVRRALEAPLRQIAANAGEDGSVIVDEVRAAGGSKGWDAKERKLVDMFAAGIVDPAKVVRSGLQNAASIAGLMLTTETLITDLKDKKKVAASAEV